MATAATRLSAMHAIEGAAGNISLFLPRDTPGSDALLRERWTATRELRLPGASSIPPGVLLITGTGRRLRDIPDRPDEVLCGIVFGGDGSATLHRAAGSGVEPTSEIDSHVGIHAAVLAGSEPPHAVVHAQPPRLTYLSHVPAYQDEARLNRQLLRWQPETVAMLPEGVRLLPFVVPGTAQQGAETTAAMRSHRVVLWAKHGVVVRSAAGPAAAVDLIDYVETAARYEVIDMQAGRPADGLSLAELRAIAARFGVAGALLDTLPEEVL